MGRGHGRRQEGQDKSGLQAVIMGKGPETGPFFYGIYYCENTVKYALKYAQIRTFATEEK